MSVIDKDGNMFDTTSSGGWISGCVILGNTGIAMSSRGEQFFLDEKRANHVEPRKRPRYTLTPSLVNDFRVGWNYFSTATVNPFSVANNATAGTDLGIASFDGDSKYNNPGIPDFGITGFNGFGSAGTNWYQNDSTSQLSEQMSWSHGAHNVMAGMEFRRLATGRAAVNSARGTFSFNGTQTGYAPADFILGTPVSFATAGPEIRGHPAPSLAARRSECSAPRRRRPGRRRARALYRAREMWG
jgi:hypothetical protein